MNDDDERDALSAYEAPLLDSGVAVIVVKDEEDGEEGEKRKRRKVMWCRRVILLASILAIAGLLYTFWTIFYSSRHRNNNEPSNSQLQKDNIATAKMYDNLVTERDSSGVLELNAKTLFNASVAEIFDEVLGKSFVRLLQKKNKGNTLDLVHGSADEEGERIGIHISGRVENLFDSVDGDAEVMLFVRDDVPELYLRLLVQNGTDNNLEAFIAERSDDVPDMDLKGDISLFLATRSNTNLTHMGFPYLLNGAPQGGGRMDDRLLSERTRRGLSIFSGFETTSGDDSKSYAAAAKEASDLCGLDDKADSSSSYVSGLVRPHVNIRTRTADWDGPIALDHNVWLTNVSVHFADRTHPYVVAYVHVAFGDPVASEFVSAVNVSRVVDDKGHPLYYTLDAHTTSAFTWTLPGVGAAYANLTIESATTSLRYDNHSKTHKVTGSVGGDVAFGESIRMHVEANMPYTDGAEVAFLGTVVTADALHLDAFPGVVEDGASSGVSFKADASFILAAYDGTFNTTRVRVGLNFRGHVEARSLDALSKEAQPLVVDVAGYVDPSHRFEFTGDMSDVQLTESIHLEEMRLRVASQSPYLSVDCRAKATKVMPNFEAAAELDFAISGEFINSSAVRFDGSLDAPDAAWAFNDAISLRSFRIAFEYDQSNEMRPVTGAIAADVRIVESPATIFDGRASAAFPGKVAEGGDDCLAFEGSFVGGSSSRYTAEDLATIGTGTENAIAARFETFDSRTDLREAVTSSAVEGIATNFTVAPGCGVLRFDVVVDTNIFGRSAVAVDLEKPKTDAHDWDWTVVVQPPVAYAFNPSSSASETSFTRSVRIVDCAIVASSVDASRSIDLYRHDGEHRVVAASGGVTLFAAISIRESPTMDIVAQATSEAEIDVQAKLEFLNGTTPSGFEVEVTLGDKGIALPHHVNLDTARMIVRYPSTPFVELSGKMSFAVLDRPMTLEVTGAVSDAHSMVLDGVLSPADLKLALPGDAHRSLVVENVHVHLSLDTARSDAFRWLQDSYIRGEADLDETTRVVVKGSIGSSDSSSAVAEIEIEIGGDDAIGSIIGDLAGESAESWMRTNGGWTGSKMLDAPLTDMVARLTASPTSFALDAYTSSLFGNENAAVIVEISGQDYLVGVALGGTDTDPLIPESAIPALKPLNGVGHFVEGAVVLTSATRDVRFPGTTKPYGANAGLDFFARMRFDTAPEGSPLRLIRRWTGVDDALVGGGVNPSAGTFRLDAAMSGDVHPISWIHLTDFGVFVEVAKGGGGVEPEIKFGLDTSFYLDLKEQALTFEGDLFIAPAPVKDTLTIGFDAEMTVPYSDAWGVRGLTIDRTSISFGMSCHMQPVTGVDCEPTDLKLGTGVHYYGSGGSGAVVADLENTANLLVFLEVDEFKLEKLVNGILAGLGEKQHRLNRTIADVGFEEAEVYVNLGTSAIAFNGREWTPGYRLSVRGFDLWELFLGNATVDVWTDVGTKVGVRVDAALRPVSLGDGGGWLSLEGSEGPSDPVRLELVAMETPSATFELKLSAAVELFGTERLATRADISDTTFDLYIDTSLLNDLFNFDLELRLTDGTPKNPKDWRLDATMNQEVLDYLQAKVNDQVNSSQSTCLDDVARWKREIESEQAKIEVLQKKIADKIRKDSASLSSVQSDVVDARGKVHAAENKVDELSDQIDDTLAKIHALSWSQLWKAPGLYAVVGALETAKKTADLALETTQGALTLALNALEASGAVLPDLDPEILAWRSEYAVAHAALTFAENALNALGGDLCSAVDWIERELAKLATLLNLRTVSIHAASFKDVKSKSMSSVHVDGVVLGNAFNKTFSMNFADVNSLAGNVYKTIVESHAPGLASLAERGMVVAQRRALNAL